MRLIFNASTFVPPLTGIGHYAWNLLERFRSHPEIDEIFCFNGMHWVDGAMVTPLTVHNPSTLGYLRDMVKAVPGAKRVARSIRGKLFSRRLAELEGAVYLEPNYICQDFTFPAVPVVHDLSHIYCPEYHPEERVRWLNDRLSMTVERCRRIVTVSQFSKRQICDYFGVDPNMIVIASPGVSESFFVKDPKVTQHVLGRYGLKSDYLLTVGALEPRKNLTGLLRAYLLLPASLRRICPLVVVGPHGWKLRDIKGMLSSYSDCKEIVALGYVPQDDLPHIYAGARAFAYPSLYEGFGMPLLEAMAQGLPVLTSDLTSMPEVVAGVGMLTNPKDIRQLASSLEQLLVDEAFREAAMRCGPPRAREFTWEKTASAVFSALQAVNPASLSSSTSISGRDGQIAVA